VAAITIQAPPEFAKAAIPLNYLTANETDVERAIAPGAELMVLGFPRGVAANNAGFPILRSGRVASYPVSPKAFPTFLLDFSVFPGNSGGPVFVSRPGPRPFIAGLLTQQVELDDERLEIGIVTHSKFILETLALMEGVQAPAGPVQATQTAQAAQPAPKEEEMVGATPASETPKRRPSVLLQSLAMLERSAAWLEAAAWSLADRMIAWIVPSRHMASGGSERQA
jgi:hypothetical protein